VAGALVDEFLAKLERGSFRQARDAPGWIKKRTRKTLSESGVRKLLRRLVGRIKLPRKSHAKKDLQAAAAFKADLSGKIQAVVGENGQDIHAVCLQQIAQSDVQVRHVIIMDQARLPPPRS
jgi:hypothetical protein